MKIKAAIITTVDMSLRYLLLNQLCDLQRSGYEVVSISSPGPNVPAIEAAGIRHIAVPMSRRAFTPLTDLQSLWGLYQVLSKEEPTVVHTHTPKAGIYGRWAARLASIPVIVHTNHGFIFQERSRLIWKKFFLSLERIAAMHSDLIFSVNEEDIAVAIREKICDRDKVNFLGRGGIGIDITRFRPSRFTEEDVACLRARIGLGNGARIVGYVGRLVREKGLLELFDAIRIVRQRLPEVRLLLVGPVDQEKPDAVRPHKASDFGISDICHFLGMRSDMPELYSLMEVVVLPSYREGKGQTPMEASAMGVPCVVTDIRGCREVVEHGRNGLLVPLGDEKALADAIIYLLAGREAARRMGEEGRRIAEERFDERLVFEKVKSEYTRLLREKGLPVPEPSPDSQRLAI